MRPNPNCVPSTDTSVPAEKSKSALAIEVVNRARIGDYEAELA